MYMDEETKDTSKISTQILLENKHRLIEYID